MKAEIELGLRLARHAGRSRMLAIVGCSALGLLLLLFCVDFPDAAHIVRQGDSRDDRLALRCLTLAIAMPVVYLISTVVRLDSDARDRRIALLRLMGLPGLRLGRIVAVEVGLLTLVGALGGVLLYAVLAPLVYPWWIRAGFVQRNPGLDPMTALGAAVFVAVAAALLAARPVMRSARHALRISRRSPRPGVQRGAAALALVGFALTVGAIASPLKRGGGDPHSILLVGLGMLCFGLGLAALTQTLIQLVSGLLRRRQGATPVVMAARLGADRVAFGRALGGLVVSTFVVAAGLCVFTAWKSTPQYASTEWAAHHETSTVLTPQDYSVDETARKARRTAGVVAVAPVYSGQVGEMEDTRQIVALDCSEIAPFAHVENCSDSSAWVARDAQQGIAGTASPSDLKPIVVPIGKVKATVRPMASRSILVNGPESGWGLSYLTDGTVVVPRQIAQKLGLSPNAVLLTLAPGERSDVGVERLAGGYASTGDWENYAMVNRMQIMVFLLAAAVMLIGALTVVVATLDLVASRRRRVAALQVIGFPPGVLRRAQWGATAVPVLIGVVLAVAAGMLSGLGYLRYGGYPESMPWNQLAGLLILGLVAGLALALATGVGMGRPLTADALRRE